MKIEVGLEKSFNFKIDSQMILKFAEASGDFNPIHVDEEFAKNSRFGKRIAHGMLSGALISRLLANEIPGPGSIYLGQTMKFERPVFIDDTITITMKVISYREDKKIAVFSTNILNQEGKGVLSGEATVLCP